MKVSEIKQLKSKMPVEITGKITRIWEVKSYQNNYGDQTKQFALIEDDTGKIGLNFRNLEDMTSLQGKTVSIKCKDTKNGLMGCRIEKYEKDGEEKEVLVVTGAAIISEVSQNTPKNEQKQLKNERYDFGQGVDIPESMKVSYKKDMWGILVHNGVDPDEATETAKRCYEKLCGKSDTPSIGEWADDVPMVEVD